MLSQQHKNLLRGLIYPIQFERDPLDGIDRILRQVVLGHTPGATPRQWHAPLRAALASNESLAKLLPQSHSEESIRAYLAALHKRVAARLRKRSARQRVRQPEAVH